MAAENTSESWELFGVEEKNGRKEVNLLFVALYVSAITFLDMKLFPPNNLLVVWFFSQGILSMCKILTIKCEIAVLER